MIYSGYNFILNNFWEQTMRQLINFYYFSQDLEVEVHQENEDEKAKEVQQPVEQAENVEQAQQVIHPSLCDICNLELEPTRMQIDHILKYHPDIIYHIPYGEWHAGILCLTLILMNIFNVLTSGLFTDLTFPKYCLHFCLQWKKMLRSPSPQFRSPQFRRRLSKVVRRPSKLLSKKIRQQVIVFFCFFLFSHEHQRSKTNRLNYIS